MATEAEIQQMYQDLFGRQAKQEGLSYWQQQGLEGDQLREALVNAAKVNSNNPNDYYSYLKSQDSYMGLVPNQVTGDQYTSARNAYRSALGTQGAGSPNFYYDPATRASLDDGATYLNADERNTNWLLAQQLAGAGKTQDEIAAALRETEMGQRYSGFESSYNPVEMARTNPEFAARFGNSGSASQAAEYLRQKASMGDQGIGAFAPFQGYFEATAPINEDSTLSNSQYLSNPVVQQRRAAERQARKDQITARRQPTGLPVSPQAPIAEPQVTQPMAGYDQIFQSLNNAMQQPYMPSVAPAYNQPYGQQPMSGSKGATRPPMSGSKGSVPPPQYSNMSKGGQQAPSYPTAGQQQVMQYGQDLSNMAQSIQSRVEPQYTGTTLVDSARSMGQYQPPNNIAAPTTNPAPMSGNKGGQAPQPAPGKGGYQ